MKLFLLLLISCTVFSPGAAENLLLNGSFEKNKPLRRKSWLMLGVENWKLMLNSGAKKCEISLSSPGASGKYALRLHTLGKVGFCAAAHEKKIPVSPGDEVAFKVKIKGTGKGYVRIYCFDLQGKKLKKYFTNAQKGEKNWQTLSCKFTVPRGVGSIQVSLETYRNNADILFDDAELAVSAGDMLENDFMSVKINRRVGGVIDSFLLKKEGLELTSPASLAQSGGFMDCILPEKRTPGILGKSAFERIGTTASSRTYRVRIGDAPFCGLELVRKFELLPDTRKLQVTDTFANNSSQKMVLKRRVRNFVPSVKGCYSYPTPDWVTLYYQKGGPLNGLNCVNLDLFRAGWIAKHFEKEKVSLVFRFDPVDVRRIYTFFCQLPAFSTVEWYYRSTELAPGEKRSYKTVLEVINEDAPWFADALGKKQKTEVIIPTKMPEPVPLSDLPPHFKENFVYCSNLGNLTLPAMAGDLNQFHTLKRYVLITDRLADELAESYINTLSTGRMHTGSVNKEFCRMSPDSKHLMGEKARRLQLKLIFANLYLNRKDLDVQKYMKQKWPKYKALLEDPDTRSFLKNYSDCFIAAFTADEIQPQNADVMLRVHKELKRYLPAHVIPLPYLNSSAQDLIPYLSIFIGDYYPIKRHLKSSGRNPWAVYDEFTSRVKAAGNVPVWFMPQGFASGTDNYAFPTSGEIRLMLYLAACAGVKGVAWHGFPSGTWPWMMNYHMYRYSMMGGAGQHTPSWEGVRDGGRFFAVAGPLLVNSKPVPVPAGAAVKSGEFNSSNHYYRGAAVKLFALKHPQGILYMAVNQNPYGAEECTVQLPQKGYDLNKLSPVGKNFSCRLAPGGCKAVFAGSRKALAACFRSLFRAERARYLLLADRLKGEGIRMVDPDQFNSGDPEKDLKALLQERSRAEKQFAATPAFSAAAELDKCKKLLEAIDFRLCCAYEVVVTPEMKKATPRYRAWKAHPDPRFTAMRNNLYKLFGEFYRLHDLIRKGSGTAPHARAIHQLYQAVEKECAAVNKWLDQHKERIDDPYEGYGSPSKII